METRKPIKFEDGQIIEGDYELLYVLPLAIACRDSSWDFPSFVMGALGLAHLWPKHCEPFVAIVPGHFCDYDVPMHPTRDDVVKIADAIDLYPDARDEFINAFPLDWDT